MIEVKQLHKGFKLAKAFQKIDPDKASDPRLANGMFHSVRDVSFQCSSGEVLGLLGPNGAGKTTTLRMLSTALQPDGGSILINGFNALTDPVEARRRIGFLSGNTGLYGRLSVYENIAYFGRLHQVPKAVLQARMTMLFDLLDMHSFIHRRADDLSTGMKQKTAIARAVVHQPDVVVLDEPTTGLDIMAKQTVLNFIQQLKAQGIPVIFSTHHFDEVALLCDHICVINEGVSVFSGTTDTLCAEKQCNNFNDAFIALVTQKHTTSPAHQASTSVLAS